MKLNGVVAQVDIDDEMVPYYCVKLDDGTEKHTTSKYLVARS